MSVIDKILSIREDGPIRALLGEPEVESTPPNAQPLISEEEETLTKVHNLLFEALTLPELPDAAVQKMRKIVNHLCLTIPDTRDLEDVQRTFFRSVTSSHKVQSFLPIATTITAKYLFSRPYGIVASELVHYDLLRSEVMQKVELLNQDPKLDHQTFGEVLREVLKSADFEKIAKYLDELFARHCPYPMSFWGYEYNSILHLGGRLLPYSKNICKVSFATTEVEGEQQEVAPFYIHKLFLDGISYFKERLAEGNEIVLSLPKPEMMRRILLSQMSKAEQEKLCELPKKKEEQFAVVKEVMEAVTVLESRELNNKFWKLFVEKIPKLKHDDHRKSSHRLRLRLAEETGKKFLWEQYVVGLARAIGRKDKEAIDFASGKKRFGDNFKVAIMNELATFEKDWLRHDETSEVSAFLMDVLGDVDEDTPEEDAKTLFSLFFQMDQHISYSRGQISKGAEALCILLEERSIARLVPEDNMWNFFYYIERILKSIGQNSGQCQDILGLIERERAFISTHERMSDSSFPTISKLLEVEKKVEEFSGTL